MFTVGKKWQILITRVGVQNLVLNVLLQNVTAFTMPRP